MLVPKSELEGYGIADDHWFARRHGEGSPISRDQYFLTYSSQLIAGIYCAIGDDTNGWEAEQYNGVNWSVANVDSAYALVITSNGLKAMASTTIGGYKLQFTGIKIIDNLINPTTPLINWEDKDLLAAGSVVFSCGTNNSPKTSQGHTLNEIMKWRFNNANGGLQYILSLKPDDWSSISDNNTSEYNIGAIGIYVKDPEDMSTDVLFGVARMRNIVTKYGTTVDRLGNTIKLNFNTVLTNIGYISNITMEDCGEQNIPEVPNESILLNPSDPQMLQYNCYLIDNFNGTGVPALAVPKAGGSSSVSAEDWVFFQPAETSIPLTSDDFATNVANYMLVYYDSTTGKYERAQGIKDSTSLTTRNGKMPMGIRVSNSIVFSGEVTNSSDSYKYTISMANGGQNYQGGDILLLPVPDKNLVFKLTVGPTGVDSDGVIQEASITYNGPSSGNIDIFEGLEDVNTLYINAEYSTYSQLPRNGTGARFIVTQTKLSGTNWNFPSNWINQPLYCSADNPGNLTLDITDSFVGWCIGPNTIRLALDLRNRATTTNYGTTRFATDAEVKNSKTSGYTAMNNQISVTPLTLKNNYLQVTRSSANTQVGDTATNPINVDTYVRFARTILGKGVSYPVTSDLTTSDIAFYGLAYRAEWADIAEFYEADEQYEPGTLITFGKGAKEISIASIECNGIISTKPGYQLGNKKSDNYLPVALTGRVPVIMDGFCLPKFGDKIYLSKMKKGCASTVENGKCLGKIIAKDFGTARSVECVVRIEF